VSSHDCHPGEILDGRYRLVVRLGRGGFGDVWRAEELLPDGAPFRDVALKLLLTSLEDTASWAEEAKLLASFRHPSLVTIYAAGILRGQLALPYVAMELLEGSTLAEIIKARGRVRWRRVLSWARSTAAALDVIHARGVVHLDLKPANLFLSNDASLKVLDFGISRKAGTPAAIRARPVVTTSGGVDANMETAIFMAEHGSDREAFATTRAVGASTGRAVVGTPGYMAPEVLELAEPTAAADAYALAVCVVQLVTGHLPHAVPNEPHDWTDAMAVSAWWTDLRNATLRGELRDLAADPAGMPAGLVRLLVRLLSVDPMQRGVKSGALTALFDEVWERPHGLPHPPYPGLSAFTKEAEGALFGREDDIGRFGREIEFEPCMVLQGARGTGKSSLVRAGLLPYLARRNADGKDDWLLVDVHLEPGAALDPDRVLEQALGRVDAELAEADIGALAAWCDKSDAGLLIVVDPLEQVFLAPPEGSARTIALLSAFAEGHVRPGLRAIGLLGERAASLFGSATIGPALRASLRFLGPPSATAAADIVGAPLRLAGIRAVGIDVVARDVQAELRAGDDRLPFVALALRAWWDATPAGTAPELRGERWTEMGGVRGALARHADRVLAGLDESARTVADEVFLRLSTMDGSTLSLPETQIVEMTGGEQAAAEPVLQALERAYLLRRRGAELTVAHEALLTGWAHLSKARARSMDRLICLERVREAALGWDRAGNHPDFLLRGALLRELTGGGPAFLRGLSSLEREFVQASHKSARLRTAGKGAAVLAVLLLLAGGALAKWLIDAQQREAERARRAAEDRAYLAEVVTKSRRDEDPYHRVAWIAEAMEKGAGDSMLPLDLAAAVSDLPRGHFLTLEPIVGPSFPWDDRWLLAGGPGSTVIAVDFRPKESSVIEDIPLDADPETIKLAQLKSARVTPIRPHAEPIVERVPLEFDTAFVTRSVGGEVRLWRLRENDVVALAATAPMRCKGAVRPAQAAPVLACATEEGIARWDLRKPEGQYDTHRFQGNVLGVSADGARVAAAVGKRVLLWAPGEGRAPEVTVRDSAALAEWSPRDRVLAVVEPSGFEILAFDKPEEPLLQVHVRPSPERVRWDPGGLDLAVCTTLGTGEWHYLRKGSRHPDDPKPQGDPCGDPPSRRLRPFSAASEYAAFSTSGLGPHSLLGGFKLADRRFLSRDLVIFEDSKPVAAQLLQFRARSDNGAVELPGEQDSIVAVERENDQTVAFQMGGEVRIYRVADGQRVLARKGNLLRRCPDGRLLAWTVEGDSYRILDPRSDGTMGTVPREPGLVIGVDAACSTLYTQRLDGTLVATPFAAGPSRSKPMATADGYVYGVRPSRGGPGHASGAPVGTGLLLALSSGAIARIDDATSTVRLLGYATPRATALADGPQPGEVAYADDTGIVLLRPGSAPERVLREAGGTVWEDIAPSSDGRSMLLVSADRLAALELGRHELAGSVPVDGKTRFTPWDSEGSLLLWSFDRMGGAEAEVIPRGLSFARRLAAAVSNLHVEEKKLVVRR
jgi:serine/threonine protein kinase